MAIRKILRNNTQSTLQIFNADVAAGSSYEIPENLWFDVARNTTIDTQITEGSIIVNNGTSDLSVEKGLQLVHTYQEVEADDVSFDNEASGLSSINVQDAIVEALDSYSGSYGYSACFGSNGTFGSGKWMDTWHNNPSNESPFVVPNTGKIRACSMIASVSTTATLTIYKNGSSITTISVSSGTKKAIEDLDIAVVKEDTISVKITSGSMKNPRLDIFFKGN